METMLITLTVVGVTAAGAPLVITLTALTGQAPRTAPSALALSLAALGGSAALLAVRHGPGLVLVTAPMLLLGIAAAVVDVVEQRLPNMLTGSVLLTGLATVAIDAMLMSDLTVAVRGVAGGAIALTMMTIARFARPDAIGWGDVKLSAGLGCYLGWAAWQALYIGLFSWWLLIAASALIGLGTGLLRRTDPVPYGPAMVLGTLLALAV